MKVLNDSLKIGVEGIDIAIQKTFARMGVKIDDIVWNPIRGGLVNNRFSIHSVQITVGDWQETIQRIDAEAIVDYSFGDKRESILQGIDELAEKYQFHLESGVAALGF